MPNEPIVAPAPEPTAAPTSVVNTDGSFAENWSEKYGDDNKEYLSRYKDLDSLVNSNISARKKMSKNPDSLVEIPNETSSDEVKIAWAKAHGVPETDDAYKYEMSEELSTKLGPVSEENMTAAKEFAKSKNWSPNDFQEAIDFYHSMMSNNLERGSAILEEKQLEMQESGRAELKKEWLADYDNRVLRANSVLRKYGGEDAVLEFNAQDSPKMAKFLDNIAGAMSEDTLTGFSASSAPTASGLKSKIADIRQSMSKIMEENPSNYKGNDKFKALQAEKTELYKKFPS